MHRYGSFAKVDIAPTVSILNAWFYDDIKEYADKHGYKLYENLLMLHEWLHVKNAPDKLKKQFHNKLKTMCENHNKSYYKNYKKWCDEYFYLPHRKEIRGIGGIFFDYKMDDWKKDFDFVKDVGLTFNDIVREIISQKMNEKFTKKDKEIQLLKRGRYVEYNLLYDRGTKFGLNTGGNIDAILMSMPPNAKWK